MVAVSLIAGVVLQIMMVFLVAFMAIVMVGKRNADGAGMVTVSR